MSPRLRWPGGRGPHEGRHTAAVPPDRSPAEAVRTDLMARTASTAHTAADGAARRRDPAEGALSETGERVAERIVAAATGGRDGVLHLIGDPSGLVHLAGGRILLVQTPAVPGIDLLAVHRTCRPAARADLAATIATREGREAVTAQAQRVLGSGDIPAVALDVLHQQAVADAAWELLATDGATLVRSRFFRGERPWTQLSRPITTDELVAEAVRRRRLLARLDVPARSDACPARVPRLRTAVRLEPLQWELVRHADGRRSVRDLARLAGRGVFATLLEVARLRRLGLLTLADADDSRVPEPDWSPAAAPDHLEVRRP